MSLIAEFVQRLVSDGLVASDDLAGCTTVEIEEIARVQHVPLPAGYREFLLLAGRSAGKLMKGSDWKYPFLLEIKKECQELVVDNGNSPDFLDGAVVFMMHQGYMFYYFPAEHVGEADPLVWMYVEGEENLPGPADGRFSNFLESQEWAMRNSRRIRETSGVEFIRYVKPAE